MSKLPTTVWNILTAWFAFDDYQWCCGRLPDVAVDDYPMLLLTTTRSCDVVDDYPGTVTEWKVVVNYPMLFGWWLPNCDAVDDYPMLLLTATQTCYVVDDYPMLHNRHVDNSVTPPCTQTNHPKWTTAPANYFDNRRPGMEKRNMTHWTSANHRPSTTIECVCCSKS